MATASSDESNGTASPARGAALALSGLGALGGFVLPPIMGIATSLIGGAEAYARGFLPLAALALFALPVVFALDRWNKEHHVSV